MTQTAASPSPEALSGSVLVVDGDGADVAEPLSCVALPDESLVPQATSNIARPRTLRIVFLMQLGRWDPSGRFHGRILPGQALFSRPPTITKLWCGSPESNLTITRGRRDHGHGTLIAANLCEKCVVS